MNNNSDCRSVLQSHVCAIPAAHISAALSLDPSAVSRIKSGERGLRFDEIPKVLALPSSLFPHGLALQNADHVSLPEDLAGALWALSREFLNSMSGSFCREGGKK